LVSQEFNFHSNNIFKGVINKKGNCSGNKSILTVANDEFYIITSKISLPYLTIAKLDEFHIVTSKISLTYLTIA